jgi:hypothetical protein
MKGKERKNRIEMRGYVVFNCNFLSRAPFSREGNITAYAMWQ